VIDEFRQCAYRHSLDAPCAQSMQLHSDKHPAHPQRATGEAGNVRDRGAIALQPVAIAQVVLKHLQQLVCLLLSINIYRVLVRKPSSHCSFRRSTDSHCILPIDSGSLGKLHLHTDKIDQNWRIPNYSVVIHQNRNLAERMSLEIPLPLLALFQFDRNRFVLQT